jgi:hypothetical protein
VAAGAGQNLPNLPDCTGEVVPVPPPTSEPVTLDELAQVNDPRPLARKSFLESLAVRTREKRIISS